MVFFCWRGEGFNSKVAGKYDNAYEEYILLIKLIIYLLISFTQHVDNVRHFFYWVSFDPILQVWSEFFLSSFVVMGAFPTVYLNDVEPGSPTQYGGCSTTTLTVVGVQNANNPDLTKIQPF